MSTPTTASAFGRDGIHLVPIDHRPARTSVGRRKFPIRDLRQLPATDETQRLLDQDVAWLSELYRDDLPLRDFSLLLADEVEVMRGLVWHRGQAIEGTLPPKQAREPQRIGKWVDKLNRRGDKYPFFTGTSAIVHSAGSRNYYHWTIEIMPRLFALREAMREGHVQPDRVLLFYDQPHGFVMDSIHALLPDLAPLVQVVRDNLTRLERCCFFVDATPDAPYENHLAHTSRLKVCTGLLSEAIDGQLAARPAAVPGRALLISRGDAPTRRLVGESQLIEAFADLGLERIQLTGLGVREQMALMADARLVVAPHGAGLTNTIYCRPGTAVIELNVPSFIRRCRSFADIAMYRGLQYGLVVADPLPSDNDEPDIGLGDPKAWRALRKLADKLMSAGPVAVS
ncbi:MAG: glycosyltransferase family 61 protein [Burkholderiaceae bacterium]